MFKTTVLAATALTTLSVAGCGTMPTERGVTGAGIGATIGLIGGPPGVLIGAAIGGTVGATTTKEDIDIGDPPRLRDRDDGMDDGAEMADDGDPPDDDDGDPPDDDDGDVNPDDEVDGNKPPPQPQ